MSLTANDLQNIQNLMTDSLAPFMESVELRFDGIDRRFDGVDGRFDGVDRRLDKLEKTQAEHTSAIRDLQVTTTKIHDRLDTIEGKLEALENDIKEIYSKLFKKPIVLSGSTDTERLLEMYDIVLTMANKLHVTLPKQVR